MPVSLTCAGRRYGHLLTYYSRDRDVTCHCVCGRLVHVAGAALSDGIVTSCGCRPAPQAYWNQRRELSAQRRREIQFGIAKAR
jgi:hypothetical protein